MEPFIHDARARARARRLLALAAAGARHGERLVRRTNLEGRLL